MTKKIEKLVGLLAPSKVDSSDKLQFYLCVGRAEVTIEHYIVFSIRKPLLGLGSELRANDTVKLRSKTPVKNTLRVVKRKLYVNTIKYNTDMLHSYIYQLCECLKTIFS